MHPHSSDFSKTRALVNTQGHIPVQLPPVQHQYNMRTKFVHIQNSHRIRYRRPRVRQPINFRITARMGCTPHTIRNANNPRRIQPTVQARSGDEPPIQTGPCFWMRLHLPYKRRYRVHNTMDIRLRRSPCRIHTTQHRRRRTSMPRGKHRHPHPRLCTPQPPRHIRDTLPSRTDRLVAGRLDQPGIRRRENTQDATGNSVSPRSGDKIRSHVELNEVVKDIGRKRQPDPV